MAPDVLGSRVPWLHGGSVNPGHCPELTRCPHVHGPFIGRSAWNVEGCLDILGGSAAAIRSLPRRPCTKIAVAGDCAGEGLARILAEHLKGKYQRAALSNKARTITMGARVIGPDLAKAIAEAFLANGFDRKGRSARNVDAIIPVDARYHKS